MLPRMFYMIIYRDEVVDCVHDDTSLPRYIKKYRVKPFEAKMASRYQDPVSRDISRVLPGPESRLK